MFIDHSAKTESKPFLQMFFNIQQQLRVIEHVVFLLVLFC